MIAILGHELQHALEALESGARMTAQVEIAFRDLTALERRSVYETSAAMDVQAQVARELRSRR